MPEQRLVLIIEDAPEIAEIFSEILKSHGLETQIVNDGAGALQAIHEHQPALILLDMHLPNISGQEILTHIRRDPCLANTRVIAVTADALLARTLEVDADLVLIKPVSYGQIRDLTRRLLV